MKDEIKKFNRENGNISYSTKELIGALHVKIDYIRDKLERDAGKISENRVHITNIKLAVGGLFTALIALVICLLGGVI